MEPPRASAARPVLDGAAPRLRGVFGPLARPRTLGARALPGLDPHSPRHAARLAAVSQQHAGQGRARVLPTRALHKAFSPCAAHRTAGSLPEPPRGDTPRNSRDSFMLVSGTRRQRPNPPATPLGPPADTEMYRPKPTEPMRSRRSSHPKNQSNPYQSARARPASLLPGLPPGHPPGVHPCGAPSCDSLTAPHARGNGPAPAHPRRALSPRPRNCKFIFGLLSQAQLMHPSPRAPHARHQTRRARGLFHAITGGRVFSPAHQETRP